MLPEPAPPFAGALPTLEALGSALLRGLTQGDTVALEGLRLTETEHNGVVWPELPASNAAAGLPVDFAWENIGLRNRRALGRLLSWYEGRTLGFEGVECRGPVERFRGFHVLTDCRVTFHDPEHGRLEARPFAHVLVRGGGHKIFRFDEDGIPRGEAVP